jgi:type II secretory pathway pseudopilin PulG
MNRSTASRAVRVPYVWLALFVCLCHLPLLLNNGVYWDGWLLYGLHATRNARDLFEMFREAGIPWFAYLHRAMWLSPHFVFAYRLTAFVCVLVATQMVYSIARRARALSVGESVLAAALFCCYPAYQLYFESITLPYVVCYACFLVAARLALAGEGRAARYWVARFASLVLFFSSFLTASFIAAYGMFVLLLLSYRWRMWMRRNPLVSLARLLSYADYYLLPLLYIYIKQRYWQSYGLYAEYNRIAIDPTQWLAQLETFASVTLIEPLARAYALVFGGGTAFVAWAVCVVVCGIAAVCLLRTYLPRARSREPVAIVGFAAFGACALFCVLLFIATAMPYIVVGKLPAATGWATRNALLVSLPAGIAAALAGRLLGWLCPPRWAARVQIAFAVPLLSAFVVATWSIYLSWELRWVKDSSTVVNLRSLPRTQIDRASLIWVDDDYARWHEHYVYYEYAGLFYLAWHTQSHFGNPADQSLDVARFASTLPRARYLLKDLDIASLSDCRVTLHVRFTPGEAHDLPIVARYYWTLWFRRTRLEAFLAPLTAVHLTDFSCSSDRYARVVSDLETIRQALEAYRTDHGAYPVAEVSINDASHPPKDRWIPGLVPRYLSKLPADPRQLPASNRQYLYMSNGKGYKLIAHGAEDANYGRVAHPERVDPRRPDHAFGFWTPDYANR